MSRIDRILARQRGDERPRRVKSRIVQVKGYRVHRITLTEPQHKTGSPWWRDRYADLVERRRAKKGGKS